MRLDQIQRIALRVVSVGDAQQRPPAEWIVRIILVNVAVVRACPGVFFLRKPTLAAIEDLFLRELGQFGINRRLDRPAHAVPARGEHQRDRRDDHQMSFQIVHTFNVVTAERIDSIAAVRSCWPKIADPATRIVAPAEATTGAVFASMPPSTSISTATPLSRII